MSFKPELQITYKAILDRARDGQVLFYSDLANQHGQDVYQARSFLGKHLKELMKICYDRNWPALPAIVVSKGEEILTRNRDKFIQDAKSVGYTVRDEVKFLEAHKSQLFEWAATASDTLTEDGVIWEPASDLIVGEDRNYWLVGSSDSGLIDQTDRFVDEGIWQNGDDGLFLERVRSVRPGDRIAIKSKFTRKNDLPFENNDKYVGMMSIKAIGTVLTGDNDGKQIEVKWDRFIEPREWYFFLYYSRINKVKNGENELALLRFVFGGEKQDLDLFLQQDFWREKFISSPKSVLSDSNRKADISNNNKESDKVPYGISDIIDDGCFLEEYDILKMLKKLKSKKNLILHGPPGTGKSWMATRLAKAFVGTRNSDVIHKQVRRVQFHPSTSYEDIVRGIRPNADGQLDLIDGIFLKMIDFAHENPDSKAILIIEEVNRGNPSQIFGEMLTLIESDKRNKDEAVELLYSNDDDDRISIPGNFYIIGTMNASDRSLASFDRALRRRFAFEVLEPILDDRWLEWCIDTCKLDRDVIEKVGKAIRELNSSIMDTHGPQFLIGHSYVTPSEQNNIDDAVEWFHEIIRTEIEPLLQDIWIGDPRSVKEQVRKLKKSV